MGEGDGVTGAVGGEGVVAPVEHQLALGPDQAGAAHYQAHPLVGRLGDLGDATQGVVDRRPSALKDGGDRSADGLGLAHRDREADVVIAAGADHLRRSDHAHEATGVERPPKPGAE